MGRADLAPAHSWSCICVLQDPGLLGVGRDLWRWSGPTPCSSRFTQSRLHRIVFRQGLTISRERDSTTLWAVLCNPHNKQVFPHIQIERPVHQFLPIAPCPVTEKSRVPSSWQSPLNICVLGRSSLLSGGHWVWIQLIAVSSLTKLLYSWRNWHPCPSPKACLHLP